MSGGAFDYVSSGSIDMIGRRWGTFAEMVAELAKAAPDAQATKQSLAIYEKIKAMDDGQYDSALCKVWHAFEWWQSGDWGEEDFRKALEAYEATMQDRFVLEKGEVIFDHQGQARGVLMERATVLVRGGQ